MPWTETLHLNKHTNVHCYECSASNSVETKQPYDHVFPILVVTLPMYQIVVPKKHFKSPFQIIKVLIAKYETEEKISNKEFWILTPYLS